MTIVFLHMLLARLQATLNNHRNFNNRGMLMSDRFALFGNAMVHCKRASFL